jgi:signal transduction histidine kinase/transcriptional regulator with XRE-family HTH domain
MPHGDPNLAALGAFIRQQRSHLQLTQSLLAGRLGWSQERISILENGKYGVPSLPALVRLAEALGVPVLALVEVLGYPLMDATASPPAARPWSGGTAGLQRALQARVGTPSPTLLKAALDQACDQLVTTLGLDRVDAYIAYMYDPPTNSLVALASSDTPNGRMRTESGLNRLPLTVRNRTTMAFERGEPFRTGNLHADPEVSSGVAETPAAQSLLAAPLQFDGATLGVLVAESSYLDRFSLDDETRFIQAANWVAMVAHWAGIAETVRHTTAGATRRENAGELVTVLAHELDSLLTPLKGRLGVLERRLSHDGRGPALDDVAVATKTVDDMQELLGRIVDVSQLDGGLLGLNLQSVDLTRLVAEVTDELRPIWPQLMVRAGPVPTVRGDPVRLREVLVNLITNVAQHSPKGSPIHLETGREQRQGREWAVVSVADEGPGIHAEVVPNLFDRWRSDGGTGGTRIGLYLSRRLVEAHGGTLTVQNAADRGTTFWMAIPVGGN